MEEKDLEYYEKIGFDFYQAWTMDNPRVPDRIKMPSGRIMDINEIDKSLEKLEFGNLEQIEGIRALEFYGLVRELVVNERQERYPTSFQDNEDMKECGRKYNTLIDSSVS